ncbi:hypothetical protein BC567DRAFT_264554 [Phyllosticta citribraziliensis]
MAAINHFPASQLGGKATTVDEKTSFFATEDLEKESASNFSLGRSHSASVTCTHEVEGQGDDADLTTTLQSGTSHNTTTTTSINERDESDSNSDDETLATPNWLSDEDLVEIVQALIESKATDLLIDIYTAQRRWEKRQRRQQQQQQQVSTAYGFEMATGRQVAIDDDRVGGEGWRLCCE